MWKTTLVLLLLTIGIGTYVSLYELRQPTPEERTRLAKQLLRITPDDVTSVIVVSPKASVTLERRQDKWHLVSPQAARADETLVQRILSDLNPLESEQIIGGTKERPPILSDYGLQTPEATLTVVSPQRSVTLLFGKATAVEENRYVALEGSSEIAVVNASLFEALDQPLDAFRSHDLLDVKTWETRQMAVTSSAHSYTLTKLTGPAETGQADRWELIAPLEDVADSAAASTILSTLRGLRIERFVADEAIETERARWGLDAPYATISLTTKEDQPPLDVVIGKVTDDHDQQRYAKRSDEPTIYAVAGTQIDELLRDPQGLRSHACFEFFASQVGRLQVDWEGRSWTVERRQDVWKTADGMVLDGTAVEEFLWKVRDVRVVRFVEDAVGSPSAADTSSPAGTVPARSPSDLARYGLDPAQGMIQVWLTGSSDPQTLAVGSTIEAGTTRYGRMAGRAAVVELPEAIHEILTKTLSRAIESTDGPV